MRAHILLLTLLLAISVMQENIYGQEKLQYSSSYDILVKAVDMQEKGNYKEAIRLYEQVYDGDSLFFRYSLPEKMRSYYIIQDYDNVIALGDKYWHFRHKLPTEFYLLYGASLDKVEEFDKAQHMYSEIMKEFPMNYSLWYNYGTSLSLSGKNKEAYEVYKHTILVNPLYDRVHHSLGLFATDEKQTTKAIMAFGMYLVLSGEKRNNFDQLNYADLVSRSKYWTDESFKGSKGLSLEGNEEFSFIDKLVHNYIALEKKYKTKSKLSYPFVKQSNLVFEQLETVKYDENNIWHRTYVRFYKDLVASKKFPGYTYYISQYIENESLAKIVKKNNKSAIDFRNWAIKNIFDRNDLVEVDFGDFGKGKVKRSKDYYYVTAFGDFNYNAASDIITGSVTYYNLAGRKVSEGMYDNSGKKTGQWKYYYPNGKLKEISNFEKGEYTDSCFVYLDNGLLRYILFYKNGKLQGDAQIYNNGILDYISPFTNGEVKEGTYRDYHPIGTLQTEYKLSNGKAEGAYISYYDTGEIEIKGNYVKGDLDGERIKYYRNGKIKEQASFKAGNYDGPYTLYYPNGQIQSKGRYFKGNQAGEMIYYYKDGKVKSIENFDETGKENGTSENFTKDGRKISEHIYKNGELTEYRFYDKDGKIISEDKRKGGTLNYKGYHENGNVSIEGTYGKKGKTGEWKKYSAGGYLSQSAEYKDGLQTGTYKEYYPNGNVETTYKNNKEGNSHGYYEDYFRNGNFYAQGYINNSKVDGPWEYYGRSGLLTKKMFYINDDREGFHYKYAITGKLSTAEFFESDLLKFTIYYDTTGMPLDTVYEVPGKRTLELRYCADCPVFMKAEIFNNVYHGLHTFYYPNGDIASKGNRFNGNEHGLWEGYYLNGKKRYEGSFEFGERTGEWTFYNFDGSISTKTNYENGERHGTYLSYDQSGKVKLKANYINGKLEGESHYYIDGKNDHIRKYEDGMLVAYTYTKAGKPITNKVINESGEILIYWSNGKLARSFTIKNGWIEGKYLKYYENGNIESEHSYVNDWESGPYKAYYPNGNLRDECNYINGVIDGENKMYYQNGKIKEICNYKYGNMHGIRTFYSTSGNPTNIWIYYDNEIIAIEK